MTGTSRRKSGVARGMGSGSQKRPFDCRFEVLEKYKPAATVKVRPPE